MAKNIQSTIRYDAIDNCLKRVNKRWTWQQLAQACGDALRERNPAANNPSRRTLFYDIKNMKSGDLGYFAPIDCVDRKFYTYEDPNFSIHKIPLDKKDFAALREVLHLMKSYQRMPLTDELSIIIQQLERAMYNRINPDNQRLLIAFDQVQKAKGQQWLDILYELIKDRHPMTINYKSFNNEKVMKSIISPYLLKEYNKRWFVVGYHHSKKEIYTFALDRIEHIEEALLKSFHEVPSFHPVHWYENIIGVTRFKDKKPVFVRIKTTPLRAKYLETKPLHHSQQQDCTSDEEVHFTFFLIPNYELESQLMAMADEIEILEPLALRNKIQSKLKAAYLKYQ